MPVLLINGKAMRLGAGFRSVSIGTASPAPVLSTVPGISSWWDAGTVDGLLPAAWGQANQVVDKSGGGVNLYGGGGNGTPVARPHLVGLLGGVGFPRGASSYSLLLPFMDTIGSWSNGTTPFGATGDGTIYLAWSRPNRQQDGNGPNNTPAPLLSINGTTVLDMTGTGTDTLRLFPNGTPTAAGSLTTRHTHTARVVFHGGLVDLWLDGTLLVSNVTSQVTTGSSINLSLLPGSGCWLHEAAIWKRALSTADHAQLTACAARWPGGNRRAVNGLLIGQSNAAYFISTANGFQPVCDALQYWTGCLGANLVNNGYGTTWAGTGIVPSATSSDDSWFLHSLGDSTPENWGLGANGRNFASTVAGMSADVAANLAFVAWMWSENDSSAFSYADKAIYTRIVKRAFALVRSTCGRTAAQLPILVMDALPFAPGPGCQMHREVMADLAADPTMNVGFMVELSTDATGQNDTWDSTTGLESGGGNSAHRDPATYSAWAARASLPIAAAVLASGGADQITALPAGLVGANGPKVVSAQYEGTSISSTGSVLVTVEHRNGTDIRLPRRAALGVGWSVLDGGSEAALGTIVTATACTRVDATHLRLTLAQPLTHPTQATLDYGRGTNIDPATNYTVIGFGNAVTDNFSSVTLPAGWSIGADTGSIAAGDMPLASTKYGVPLT